MFSAGPTLVPGAAVGADRLDREAVLEHAHDGAPG